MTAGEARGDMKDTVTLRRIARLVCNLFVVDGSSRVVIRFEVAIYGVAQPDHSNTLSVRKALTTPDLVSVRRTTRRFERHVTGHDKPWPSSMLRCKLCASRHGVSCADNLIGPNHMIEFPNHSRSYDRTRHAVRFWGHDSAIEASFFIDEDALRRIQPDARSTESGLLNVFDSNRDLICAAAAKVYVRGSRGSYDLVAANF
jgi:Protein of unknown function (DUF1488)